jgi:hypothetical protein
MDDRYVSNMVFDGHEFAYFQYQYFGTLCRGLTFLRIMLSDPQISESMLISCGVDNKFVLVQKCNGGPGVMCVVHNLSGRELCSLDNIFICMRYIFTGCLRELCNTTFCIINIGCCPLLNRLEGNKNSLMNILFFNLYILRFLFVLNFYIFIIPQKNLERL